MTDTNPNTDLPEIEESPEVSNHWAKQENTDIRSLAMEHVVGLYLANATKNTSASKTYVDMDKSVYDLVADSRHIVEYLKGLVD